MNIFLGIFLIQQVILVATVDIFHYNIFASFLPTLSISLLCLIIVQGGLSWTSFLEEVPARWEEEAG